MHFTCHPQWMRYWGQIAWMQKLSPHGCSTLAPVATHPTFYWNINQQILIQQQQHGICQFSFKENWKMLSATRLTVALTMKTNTLVFSIGFQYIRQLAKFGRKEGIFYPEPAAIFLHFALQTWSGRNVMFKVFLFYHSMDYGVKFLPSKTAPFWCPFYIFFISGFHFSAPQSVTVPLGSYYPRLLSHCPPAVHIDCQKPLSGGEVPKYPSIWHSVTILVGQKSPGLSLRWKHFIW